MNLKEAFHYQNVLTDWIEQGQGIIMNNTNSLNITDVVMHSGASAELQDVSQLQEHDSPLAEHFDRVIAMEFALIDEKEALSKAIRVAKEGTYVDIDAETTLNKIRQNYINRLRYISGFRAGDKVLRGVGKGSRFNAEGNQIFYTCDITRHTELNFDKDEVKRLIQELNTKTAMISAEIDEALITTVVNFQPAFDVNCTFDEMAESFIASAD